MFCNYAHTMKNDWKCENSLVNVYDSYALGWLLFIAYPFSIFLFHIILYFLSLSAFFCSKKIFTDVKPSDAFTIFLHFIVNWALHWIFFEELEKKRIEMNVQWNYISCEALLYNHPCIHPSFLLLCHSQKNFIFIVPCSFVLLLL